jgi:glutamate-ammonia-ligase adenylyltransferase
MTDIEFMVQYAVLRWAAEHPALVSWTDNLRLLETIADLELLPATACRQLRDAYFAYRADIHQSALQQVDGLVDQKRFLNHRRQVSAVWQDLFE